jgi:hypothetical protein
MFIRRSKPSFANTFLRRSHLDVRRSECIS